MNLTVDAGNSFVKIAVMDKDGAVASWQTESFTQELLRRIVEEYAPQRAIVAASGAGGAELCRMVGALVPQTMEMTPLVRLPIGIDYATPHTLGADRIAAAVGAVELYGNRPMLIVDFGTAITFDLVVDGVFRGGNISPGVRMRFEALHERTARLPLCSEADWVAGVGNSTRSAIAAGVIEGIVNEVEGYISRFSAKEPGIMTIFCGGGAEYFVNRIKNAIFANCNMTNVGLNRILEYNAVEGCK